MTALFATEDRTADVSECGRYRYSLTRCWDKAKPTALFVMLNPSTAGADVDDPTIRRCIGFAKRWGMGGIEVCNLYPWRATDPKELPKGLEVCGEQGGLRNVNAIIDAAERARRIIAAWGANRGPHPGRDKTILYLLGGYPIEALALTKNGAPRHPLYVRADVDPVPFA